MGAFFVCVDIVFGERRRVILRSEKVLDVGGLLRRVVWSNAYFCW